ncbi:type II secretion system GspH family protein [Patescibacteria group bacterium]|nr:type II secretion system GspH family protein [Patescibacteria group bacterium]MCL5091544.1 type II secretion system GspH family protein [Patescibacteria group bacterium]
MVHQPDRGFTLIELILVMGILSVLIYALFSIFDPLKQFYKARDSKKKTELSSLKRTLEDWYNDKGCYPKAEEICYGYESGGNIVYNHPPTAVFPAGVNQCYVCGLQADSPEAAPYATRFPCSPQHRENGSRWWRQDFAYEADSLDADCPQSYRIYAKLEYPLDPAIRTVRCIASSCGPQPDSYGYNYGISSPNSALYQSSGSTCLVDDNLGSQACQACGPAGCSGVACRSPVYSSWEQCCSTNPNQCP